MEWLVKRRNNIIKKKLFKKNIAFKSLLFVIGTFISALAFNLFYVPHNFVAGGLGGVAIIINNFISVDVNTVIIIGDALFILISIFTLGFKESLLSIVGSITYIIFVLLTSNAVSVLNFSFDNIILYVIAAGFVGGFGEALVYKSGFNTGGTSIISMVIQKYVKMPLGRILRIISITIILAGGFTFGYTAIMYGVIISLISTYMVDRILIGISDSKTVFIQTSKVEEVKDYIIRIIGSGITEMETKGGYSNKKNKMIMCVVPSEKYDTLKSAVEEIDNNAFIVVNDCYEVFGGTKKKRLSFDD